jgi:hypothetical protein
MDRYGKRAIGLVLLFEQRSLQLVDGSWNHGRVRLLARDDWSRIGEPLAAGRKP